MATSEIEVLRCIDKHFDNSHPALLLGRGDDCAIFKPGQKLCVSSDLFIEDIHYRASYFLPEEIGCKALAVNISDLAAMGSRPIGFNLNLGLPPGTQIDWLDRFFAGMAQIASLYGIALIGGDLSASPIFNVSITIFGECAEGCALLRRGGIMPGDVLFLIGDIGLARVGLSELESQGRAALNAWPAACKAHLQPVPKIGPGLMLARAGQHARPPSLMDVSDGLGADLPRLLNPGSCPNRLGAAIDLPESALHPEVIKHARLHARDPVQEAFMGGEDYALLGACAPDMLQPLTTAIRDLVRIGVVTPVNRITLNGRDAGQLPGFDHFNHAITHADQS